MNLSQEAVRCLIFYDFKKGMTQKQCIESLKAVYGDDSPSKTTVYHWFAEFRRGRVDVSDAPREGRPRTLIVPATVDAVRKVIEADRNVTYKQIRASLGLSTKTIQTILHEELGVRKVCARWMPQNLRTEQKEARVQWCREMLLKFEGGASSLVNDILTGDESWIYSYEPSIAGELGNPTRDVCSSRVSEQMVASFFGRMGHVATVPFTEQRTLNSEWYYYVFI